MCQLVKHDEPTQPSLGTKANMVSDRLRYALATLGLSQTSFLPQVNDALQHIAPKAAPFNAFTLSRTLTGKRPVKDFELLAFAHALQIEITWLIGLDAMETLRDDVWKLS